MENPADPNPDRSVMIALLPTTTAWCKIRLPHMTLVYAGIIDDLKSTDQNELLKEGQSLSLKFKPMTLRVTGVDVFGSDTKDNPSVDVLRLRTTTELSDMRKSVVSWNASDFPFNPHCTIGPKGSAPSTLPLSLTFDRLSVNWGNETNIFRLRGKQ